MGSALYASAEPNTSVEALERVISIAETGMKEQQLPGLALVIMKADEVILARGFGREALDREDAVTANTVFALGSISKQFVAALVLQLADEKKLSLDDAVLKHLPEFTHVPPELRVRHLLSHTSGMREEFVQPELGKLFDEPGTTFTDYVEAARHSPHDWPPGSRWSYGNVNYLMLTLIVERLTGEPLEKTTGTRLFEPVGLTSMRLCSDVIGGTAGEARGYITREGALTPHPAENISLFRGSGGYCGSALDVARWTRALAAGKVIGQRGYKQISTRTRLNDGREAEYGFAMDLGAHDGVQRNGHGGYGGGFSAQAAYYPNAELTVVVLTNRFFAFPETIERKISRHLLGIPEPAIREVPLAPEELKRYAGSYDLGIHGWSAEIVVRDGKLHFELKAPRLSLPLVHVGNHEFVSEPPAVFRLTFSENEPGRELRLVGMGMMTWYGLRRP
jgi:CubicO group peptidase (beta-lactamase class C family)